MKRRENGHVQCTGRKGPDNKLSFSKEARQIHQSNFFFFSSIIMLARLSRCQGYREYAETRERRPLTCSAALDLSLTDKARIAQETRRRRPTPAATKPGQRQAKLAVANCVGMPAPSQLHFQCHNRSLPTSPPTLAPSAGQKEAKKVRRGPNEELHSNAPAAVDSCRLLGHSGRPCQDFPGRPPGKQANAGACPEQRAARARRRPQRALT